MKTERVRSDLRVGSHRLPLGDHTWVMAVINLSPDSRNRHTIASTPRAALRMATGHRAAGAAIIDLGGQSSHFENPTITPEEEIRRLVPTVELLASEGFLVSIDTWKPEVARACLAAGALIINDTGGLTDPAMVELAAEFRVPAVVVYVEGAHPHDVSAIETGPGKAGRIAAALGGRLGQLSRAGVEQVILDPGIALNYRGDYEAYTQLQLDVIREIEVLRELGRPVLIPIPRKRQDHRVMAYITLALEHRADLIRVHDVEAACDLVALLGRAAPSFPS